MHAASRHGTPSLTSLPKDDEVSCEVRAPWSGLKIQSNYDGITVSSIESWPLILHAHPTETLLELMGIIP